MLIFLIVTFIISFLSFIFAIYTTIENSNKQSKTERFHNLLALRNCLEGLKRVGNALKFRDENYFINIPYIQGSNTLKTIEPDPFHPLIPRGGIMVIDSHANTIAILPNDFSGLSVDDISSLLQVTVGLRFKID